MTQKNPSTTRCDFEVPTYEVQGSNNPLRCRYDSEHPGPHVFVWIPSEQPRASGVDATWAHVICDAETHEPALLSPQELEDVKDCLGTSRIVLESWIAPGLAQ